MTGQKRRWQLVGALVLTSVLLVAMPRTVRFVERSLDLADKMAEIRQGPTMIYLRHEGFYHFGRIPDPGQTEAAADTLLASIVTNGDGISLAPYPPPLGKQFSPVNAASAALSAVAYMDDSRMPAFIMAHLDALIAWGETTAAGNLVFPYRFDWPPAGQKAPWYSAMAQGQAASAFLWGHRLFGRAEYLDAARRAILALAEDRHRPFFKILPDGNRIWLKEYPGYRFNVLDGSLSAISGVYDLWRSLAEDHPDHPRVAQLLERSMAGLKWGIACFEHSFWGHVASDFGYFHSVQYYRANLTLLNYLSEHEPALSYYVKAYRLPDRSRVMDVVIALVYRAWDFLKNKGFIDKQPCF